MRRRDFTVSGTAGDVPCVCLEPDQSAAGNLTSLAVVPSVFGVDSTFLLHCKRFTTEGFRVFALDSFWRTCPGPLVPDEAGKKQAMDRMAALDDADCDADVTALLEYIRHNQSDATLIGLGICFGGRPIVKAAIDGHLDGVAAWHGVRIGTLKGELARLPCPASLQFGSADAWTPADEIKSVRAELADREGIDIQVHAGCDHGFTHLDRKPVFSKPAYDASMLSLLALPR